LQSGNERRLLGTLDDRVRAVLSDRIGASTIYDLAENVLGRARIIAVVVSLSKNCLQRATILPFFVSALGDTTFNKKAPVRNATAFALIGTQDVRCDGMF
jgi:hypothetical protein